METFISSISQKEFPIEERMNTHMIRKSILKLIQKDYPHIKDDDDLSISEFNYYREKYISECLIDEIGEFTQLKNNVLDSLRENTLLTDKLETEDRGKIKFGQFLADKVASFGGSWIFIIIFSVFLLLWITTNVFILSQKAFDPYPFILLNLFLSCLAAIQAPIIMMSQNRQEEKDRERAKKDFMINLKSELEIRILNEKIDHLITHQQQELIEIQNIQIDMLNDIIKKMKS